MNISRYRAFLRTQELGSCSKAALELGYTQSGLTYILNSLEREIGFPLLLRGYFGVRLTPRGEQLLPHIRQLVESADRLEADIRRLSDSGFEVLRIGSFSSMTQHWLPSIVERYHAAFPHVRVEMESASVDELYNGLLGARYDLIFISRSARTTTDWIPLWEDPLMAVLPADYPMPEGDSFPVKAFEGKRFLMPGLGFNLDVMRIFEASHVKPDIISTSLDDPFIMSMVEHSIGISMLSQLILSGGTANLKALPIAPAASRELGIAVTPARRKQPYIHQFIRYAQDFTESYQTDPVGE